MNEVNASAKPSASNPTTGASDPKNSTITRPVVQPVEPAKMPDAALSEKALKKTA